ncbi:MAG TPA: amino acid adenylation domain-containing protein [Pyrinomonadaceae bacterium]
MSDLRGLGIMLWADGDHLRCRAPKDILTPELTAELKEQKAHILEYLRRAGESAVGLADADPLTLVPPGEPLRPSFSQLRLWFLDRLEGRSPAYNMPLAARLEGTLNREALQRALNEIMRRHSVLRSNFAEGDGEPIVVIRERAECPLAYFDSTSDSRECDPRTLERRLMLEEAERCFDLETDVLIRASLHRVGETSHLLFVTMHHIVSDGWSLGIFTRELAELYEAFIAGREPTLVELPIQYTDYANWQRRRLSADLLQRQLDYWRNELRGAPDFINLPLDRPRPAVQTYRGCSHSFALDAELARRLQQFCQATDTTRFMALLTAFALVLSRYNGQNEVVVGTAVANRARPETEALIGLFVNTLALRIDLSGDPTGRELAARVRETCLKAYEHQDVPFEQVVEALKPARDLSHSPLFQVSFDMQDDAAGEVRMDEFALMPIQQEAVSSKFELGLSVEQSRRGLSAVLCYNSDLFDAETIERLAAHFVVLLRDLTVRPDARLSQLRMMGEAEREQVVYQWNDTQQHLPADHTLIELFDEQAKHTPERIAIKADGHSLSYADLLGRANRLARYLRGLGVSHESLVAVFVERSPDLIISLLGIMKAGGAYVPLEPSYPRNRLADMLDDARPAVILTRESLAADLPDSPAYVVYLDRVESELNRLSTESPLDRPAADNLAYVIYTSGSTGRPKGVQISHRSLANFLCSMRREPGLNEHDTLLAVTTISFDIAALELFLPLVVGGGVVVADRATALDPQKIANAIEREGATFVQATPATWRMLLDVGWRPPRPMRIASGGEALPGELAWRLRDLGLEVWNLYGPTETTIWSAVRCLPGADQIPRDGIAPIGKPIDNTQLYVLDPHFSPQPVGIPGELYIGGEGLARGYLNRPDMTAERYCPDPFSGQPGARLYRTGDLVRRLSNGEIEFMGRLDNQVKVRGFRIELGEIESALLRHEAIGQAVVVAREDALREKQLVAYVVPTTKSPPATEELRAFLKLRLPEFMIPSSVVFLDSLPRTPNGKVDRKALPAPDRSRPELRAVYQPPRTPTEKEIAAIWKIALDIDQVGIDDNFFDLGGHSLLMTRVHAQLRSAVASNLSLVELFQYPTVRALAAKITPGEMVTVTQSRPRPAMPDQQRDIAVIGVVGRFPDADDLGAFWRNLREGRDSISFISTDELIEAGVEPELVADPNYVPANGILSDVTHFDAGFFGITPAEAEVMDPQHRIFLESAWHVLEHAGYGGGVGEQAVGVFAACSHARYLIFNLLPHLYAQSPHSIYQVLLGNDRDYLATRASYLLNLRGPSVNVQTACSSSLVAVHMACQSLLAGESDMAMAGGVAIKVPQKSGYLYSEGMIVSPDGHCRAFDARANGTTWGSGIGVVLLKRLEQARADGDTVYAVIKGSAINNDGSLKVGFTAPGVDGQSQVIVDALACAGIDPASITYVEAHGTGTPMGDPAEVAALTRAFGVSRNGRPHCALGSVKSNIGHLDTAAGITGLIKTILALRHREIPPSIHFDTPNPQIDFQNSPFFVNDRLRNWDSNGHPRRAGVSSFGLGGTNAHLIVEESPVEEPPSASRDSQVIVFSARTDEALDQIRSNLTEFFRAGQDISIADAAYTQAIGRAQLPHRAAFVCRDSADAAAALVHPQRLRRGTTPPAAPDIVFMFPGQGEQYAGMGSELYRDEPVYREAIDRCADLLKIDLGIDLRAALYPANNDFETASLRLNETWLTQPALFATEYALARLWMSWGIRPGAMIGHSIGEYVAACLANVFDLTTALRLVAARGRLIWQQPEGAMLAVALSQGQLEDRLPTGLSIAAINAPNSFVVAGSPAGIDEYAVQLGESGIACRRLKTSHAFHSEMMDSVTARFYELLREVKFGQPAIPFISNVSGTWIRSEVITDPDYWVKHLRQTVRFADGICQLLSDPHRLFLEVGPGDTLSKLTRRQPLADKSRVVVSSISGQRNPGGEVSSGLQSEATQIADALAQLWCAGADVDWTSYFGDQQRRRVAMPLYPFERQRHWVDPLKNSPVRVTGTTKKLSLDQWFHLPTWSPSLPPGRISTGRFERSGAPWLIFTNGCKLGLDLIERLDSEGQSVVCVEESSEFACFDARRFALRPDAVSDYERLITEAAPSGFRKIVHLWNLRSDHDTDDAQETRRRGYESLVCLAQALTRRSLENPITIAVVSDWLHDVFGQGDVCPDTATLLGPCLVIPQEHPHLTIRTIDVPRPSTENVMAFSADALLAEIEGDPADPHVAYRGQLRFVPRFERVELVVDEDADSKLRDGGVYLITGGLGRVGLQIAELLFDTVGARLCLLGRTSFPDAADWQLWLDTHDGSDATSVKIRRLIALRNRGAEILVLRADVSLEAEMRTALAEIQQRFGVLHGVIHAAGALDDPSFTCALEDIDAATSQAQFRPKVEGLRVLERVVRDVPLDFCLLISSNAAVLGGLGFTAYSAANRFMDAFAAVRNRSGAAPWSSTNWDAWSFDNTSATELSMSPAESREALRRVLSRTPPGQLVIATGDLSSRYDQWVRRQGWRTAGEASVKTSHARPKGAGRIVVPGSATERLLVDLWKELFGFSSISIDDDFFELGGDSLTGIRLMSMIKDALGKRASLNLLLKEPTIRALAAALDRKDAAPVAWSPLVPIQPDGSKRPFFCVPGTGGSVVYLRDVARALGKYDRPFYGFQSAGLDGRTSPLDSVEQLAAANITALLEVQKEGPYFLGGHSFGSWVALEMAHQLKKQGREVALLAILDTAAPAERDTSALAVRNDMQWLVAVANMLQHLFGKAVVLNLESLEGLDWPARLERFAQSLVDAKIISADADRSEVRGLVDVYKTQAQMLYRPKAPYPLLDLVLLRAAEPMADFVDGIPETMKKDETWGWSDYGQGAVHVETIPGDHLTMMTKPHCNALADGLNKLLARRENQTFAEQLKATE